MPSPRPLALVACAFAAVGCSLAFPLDDLTGQTSTSSSGGAGLSITVSVSGSGAMTTSVGSSAMSTGTGGTGPDLYRQAVLDDGPLYYMRLGESAGTQAFDAVSGTPAGNYLGGYVQGAPGAIVGPDTAVQFTGGAVTLADFGNLDFAGTASYSLECWFKVNVGAAGLELFPRILSKEETMGATREGYNMNYIKDPNIGLGNGAVQFERWNGSSDQILFGPAPPGEWFHVVGTFDGTTLQIYLNGAAQFPTVPGTHSLTNTMAPFAIGAHSDLGEGQFPGVVDEVAIYGKVLTPPQIQHHYDVGRGM